MPQKHNAIALVELHAYLAMLASIIEAPQQVRISTSALPQKAEDKNYPELIKGVTLDKILDINVTKKGVLYIRYATKKGRGCSFVSFPKFRRCLEEIQMRRWPDRTGVPVDSISIAHIMFGENERAERMIKFWMTINGTQNHSVKSPVSQVAPFVAIWNNQFLISAEEAKASITPPAAEHKPVPYDAWGAAQKELNQHIKQQGDAVVDINQLRINREKRDLEAEAAKRKCSFKSFEDSGDTIYQVTDESGKNLGYIAIDAAGKVFYRSSKEGSKEQKVNGATGAVRGLIDAQTFDRATAKSGIMFSKVEGYAFARKHCNEVYGRR